MSNPVLDQERVQHLLARQGNKPKRQLLPAWPRPGVEKELPLDSLEIQWVRFSTLNHRTRSEQMRITELRQRPDLFTADPLGSEAQAEQFAILRGQEGFEDLKADLKERGQQQPAVVTAEGVLINGNRRAAALRSLFSDDDHQPSRYISCFVLPADATTDELVDLETELQIAREFKEDYTWVNEALLIEEIFNREGKDWQKVARRMHKDAKAVRTQYEKLQQLHQLVALSNGTRHHADFVENDSAFNELAQHIKGKSQAEAASVRSTYFLGTLTGVTYRELRHLRRADASQLVLKQLSEEPALSSLMQATQQHSEQPADILDEVLGGSQQGSPAGDLNPILSYFAKQGGQQEVQINGTKVPLDDLMNSVGRAINDAADEAKNQADDTDAVQAPVKHLQSAIKTANRAVEALPKARATKGWNEAEYKKLAAQLRSLANNLGEEQ